ncbi:MAG: hypothetical protein RR416_02500 [Clostridia bacterium]
MEYIKSSLIFIKNNFLKMFCYAIAPAMLIALLINPVSTFNFIISLPKEDYSRFGEIFVAMNNFGGWKFLIMAAIVVLSSILISGELGLIHRKMYYGVDSDFSFKKFWAKVNNYVIPIFLTMVGLFVVVELVMLLLSMFVFFWLRAKMVVTVILSVITAFVLFGILILGMTLVSLTLPNMTIRGYFPFKAVRNSAKTVAKNMWKVFIAFILPLLVMIAPACLINLISFPGDIILHYVTSCVFFIAMIMYYLVLCYVVFFDLEEMEREDIKESKQGGYTNAN